MGEFSARYFRKTFSDKVVDFQSIGCDIIRSNVFDKIYRSVKSFLIRSFFGSVFPPIQCEYEKIKTRKKISIWTLFTQCTFGILAPFYLRVHYAFMISCQASVIESFHNKVHLTARKMKFSIKDFFSKCDQIRSFLPIWSPLMKKSLLETWFFMQCL